VAFGAVREDDAAGARRDEREALEERVDARPVGTQRLVQDLRLVVVELRDHGTADVRVLVVAEERERAGVAREPLEVADELRRLVHVGRAEVLGPRALGVQVGGGAVHEIATKGQHGLVAARFLFPVELLQPLVVPTISLQVGRDEERPAIGKPSGFPSPDRGSEGPIKNGRGVLILVGRSVVHMHPEGTRS